MTKIAIITGSVRPGRQSLNVANWVKSIACLYCRESVPREFVFSTLRCRWQA